MGNRMSVLSRRLERFAVGFSIATFAFVLLGFVAAAKTEGQAVFLCAGLAAACLFAAFFLWLAHGFAWAMIPEELLVARKAKKPVEALNLADALPTEAVKPTETLKPVPELRPAEALKPADTLKPAATLKPAEALKPAETLKPAEGLKPADTLKPAEAKRPAEEEVIAEEDPPDAKYTITGRRVY